VDSEAERRILGAERWIQGQSGGFRGRAVDSGAEQWIQEQSGRFRGRAFRSRAVYSGAAQVDSGAARWIPGQSGGFSSRAVDLGVLSCAYANRFRVRAVDSGVERWIQV
jgi:hypothetical protein